MTESMIAYFMGPIVMIVVGAAIWAANRYSRKDDRERQGRWLDTHHVDWMRHKH
ncbi:hypothetical protein [Paraburkholderia sp. GAS334]|uniref:hypothetical protein n=1 Tax=unclassified Paraburkholderia TaxID=2615204 RepID=UPI003D1ADE25